MITLKFLCYLWQMIKEDKSFEVGMVGGLVVIVCAVGWMISLPLIALDLLVLFLVTMNRYSNAQEAKRLERRARELQAKQEAEAAERLRKAQELARIEANSVENRKKRADAVAALEPAVNQIRRFWAKHHLVLKEEYPLKLLNECIRDSVSESSPFSALIRLDGLKDALITIVVRFETEQLYEKWYEYISEAVPREEFDRLMKEAEEESGSVDEYGRRMIQLGEFLSEAAGPAAVKWHKEEETGRIANYEALFSDDAESPFDEAEEDRSASRVG